MTPPEESQKLSAHEEKTQTTRTRILEAARQEFVERGLEGARIELVAKRAGVNKALIYRHFTDKDRLFQAVLEGCYHQIRAAERALDLPADPLAALDKICGFTLDYYRSHPDLLVLVGIENLHGGEHIRHADRAGIGAEDLLARMAAIVQRGEQAGLFRSGIDPAELWQLLSALCWVTVANAHTSGFTFGVDMLHPDRIGVRLDNICQMVRRFVAAQAAAG